MATTFPQKFGKYVLVRKIATGGMAEIFQAKTAGAEGFEKDIVIKRILPHFSEDEAFVKMFIDEASITAKLQHANIVQIYDFDVMDGSYYIAMEYIEGEDLDGVLKAGDAAGRPLSVSQCVWVTMELAKGLHYAHQKEHKGRPLNIIHRDISPHNAMIAYNGGVKLMDFGIAKAAERSTKTQAGTVKGKVAYMSPEQARGKKLDPRSDLFALATVLWEMLTRKRLFLRVTDFETLTAVLKADTEAPSLINPGVDQELDDILLTALEKDRQYRQTTVEEFNRELTRWYYKNVTDLDADNLKRYMQSIYADKIGRLRQAEGDLADTGSRARPRTGGGTKKEVARRSQPRESTAERKGPWTRSQRVAPSDAQTWDPEIDDGGAMTIEAPVPELLKAKSPARASQPDARPVAPPRKAEAAKPEGNFFSSPETIMEDQGPTQEEVMRALQESRRQSRPRDAPDMTLAGRGIPAPRTPPPKSSTGLIVVLALLFLVLGGVIAFLVAP